MRTLTSLTPTPAFEPSHSPRVLCALAAGPSHLRGGDHGRTTRPSPRSTLSDNKSGQARRGRRDVAGTGARGRRAHAARGGCGEGGGGGGGGAVAPVEVLGWVRGGAGASAGSGRVGLSAGGGSLRPSWAARDARAARGGRRPKSAGFANLRVWWCRDAASACALEQANTWVCCLYIGHPLL